METSHVARPKHPMLEKYINNITVLKISFNMNCFSTPLKAKKCRSLKSKLKICDGFANFQSFQFKPDWLAVKKYRTQLVQSARFSCCPLPTLEIIHSASHVHATKLSRSPSTVKIVSPLFPIPWIELLASHLNTNWPALSIILIQVPDIPIFAIAVSFSYSK